MRKTRLTERAVNQIMYRYPISINGVMTVVQPHDLRRTYARNAYLHGMDAERIRQNLGHAHLSTTQDYIGRWSGEQPTRGKCSACPTRLKNWYSR